MAGASERESGRAAPRYLHGLRGDSSGRVHPRTNTPALPLNLSNLPARDISKAGRASGDVDREDSATSSCLDTHTRFADGALPDGSYTKTVGGRLLGIDSSKDATPAGSSPRTTPASHSSLSQSKPLLAQSWCWSSQGEQQVEDRREERWQESNADVGNLYATGIHQIGRLFFSFDDELMDEPARFAGVSTRTDADAIVKLLLSYWRIQVPSVLLTVSGSAQAMDLEPRLENMLRDGIDSAASSTRAWVITGGMDTGVMELVGRALRSRTTTNVRADGHSWATPLIGIAPLGCVTNQESLRQAKPGEGMPPPLLPYIKRIKNSSASSALDMNHSHFILVDDPGARAPAWGAEIELRGQVERRLVEKLMLPSVLLVIQVSVPLMTSDDPDDL